MIARLIFGLLVVLALAAPLPAQEPEPAPPAEEEETFDPLRAEQSLKVGEFYLRKKNYEAAIDRFHDALRYKPNFALPHRRLGEAYEKLGEREKAVEHFRKYLEILPAAGDARRVQRRIERLEREIERRALRRSPQARQIAPGGSVVAEAFLLAAEFRGV
jgi:tetratricopeptide (TPR) repeat protein